jgi:hypothetical protein
LATGVAAGAPDRATTQAALKSETFWADPNRTHNLRPWLRFDPGNADASDGILVSDQPHGASSPGVVRIVRDPLRRQGLVYRETVTPAAHASNATDSDSVYLWNSPGTYLGNNGQQNWIHFRIMFPSSYRPTSGEWNIFTEFHNNSGYQKWYDSGRISLEYPELALYVTNYTGGRPRLMWRVRGGTDGLQDMSVGKDVFDLRRVGKSPFRRGHWYDMLLHVVWSPDPTRGRFAWWLDGRRQFDGALPTLWRRPDGSTDHVQLELNNYREHVGWNATVYYSKIAVGPTRASVAFRRP